VLSLSYDFHLGTADNGNVYAIANNRDTTRSTAYSYDLLNRIATAETSQSALWGQSFGYDGRVAQQISRGCPTLRVRWRVAHPNPEGAPSFAFVAKGGEGVLSCFGGGGAECGDWFQDRDRERCSP